MRRRVHRKPVPLDPSPEPPLASPSASTRTPGSSLPPMITSSFPSPPQRHASAPASSHSFSANKSTGGLAGGVPPIRPRKSSRRGPRSPKLGVGEGSGASSNESTDSSVRETEWIPSLVAADVSEAEESTAVPVASTSQVPWAPVRTTAVVEPRNNPTSMRELMQDRRKRTSVPVVDQWTSRGSRRSFASFLSSDGDSIYEDALEGEDDDDEMSTTQLRNKRHSQALRSQSSSGSMTKRCRLTAVEPVAISEASTPLPSLSSPSPAPLSPWPAPPLSSNHRDSRLAVRRHSTFVTAATPPQLHSPPQRKELPVTVHSVSEIKVAATSPTSPVVPSSPRPDPDPNVAGGLRRSRSPATSPPSLTTKLVPMSSSSSAASNLAMTVIPLRRYSALQPARTVAPTTIPTRRSSTQSTSSNVSASTTSASRRGSWQPKPLVLTPARTIHTPLIGASSSESVSLPPPSTRRSNSARGSYSTFATTASNPSPSPRSSVSHSNSNGRPTSPIYESDDRNLCTPSIEGEGTPSAPESTATTPRKAGWQARPALAPHNERIVDEMVRQGPDDDTDDNTRAESLFRYDFDSTAVQPSKQQHEREEHQHYHEQLDYQSVPTPPPPFPLPHLPESRSRGPSTMYQVAGDGAGDAEKEVLPPDSGRGRRPRMSNVDAQRNEPFHAVGQTRTAVPDPRLSVENTERPRWPAEASYSLGDSISTLSSQSHRQLPAFEARNPRTRLDKPDPVMQMVLRSSPPPQVSSQGDSGLVDFSQPDDAHLSPSSDRTPKKGGRFAKRLLLAFRTSPKLGSAKDHRSSNVHISQPSPAIGGQSQLSASLNRSFEDQTPVAQPNLPLDVLMSMDRDLPSTPPEVELLSRRLSSNSLASICREPPKPYTLPPGLRAVDQLPAALSSGTRRPPPSSRTPRRPSNRIADAPLSSPPSLAIQTNLSRGPPSPTSNAGSSAALYPVRERHRAQGLRDPARVNFDSRGSAVTFQASKSAMAPQSTPASKSVQNRAALANQALFELIDRHKSMSVASAHPSATYRQDEEKSTREEREDENTTPREQQAFSEALQYSRHQSAPPLELSTSSVLHGYPMMATREIFKSQLLER